MKLFSGGKKAEADAASANEAAGDAAAASDVMEPGGEAAMASDRPSMGYYKDLQALSPSAHAALRYTPNRGDYRFARGTRLAPITAREFPRVALDFPIVFAGERMRPCAVMGFVESQNLFIDAEGRFEAGVYVPAFLRQYPFMLSTLSGVKDPVVAIDRASSFLSETEGQPLFEGGEPTEVVRTALTFMRELTAQWGETELFTTQMSSLGLIKPTTLKLSQAIAGERAEPRDVVEYFAIAVSQLGDLSEADYKLLFGKNYFTYIYAHVVSLQNWPKLIERVIREQSKAA